MSQKQNQKGDIRITVKGNVGGQIAIGNGNAQSQTKIHKSVTPARIRGLRK